MFRQSMFGNLPVRLNKILMVEVLLFRLIGVNGLLNALK